jgi:hypothetical protein
VRERGIRDNRVDGPSGARRVAGAEVCGEDVEVSVDGGERVLEVFGEFVAEWSRVGLDDIARHIAVLAVILDDNGGGWLASLLGGAALLGGAGLSSGDLFEGCRELGSRKYVPRIHVCSAIDGASLAGTWFKGGRHIPLGNGCRGRMTWGCWGKVGGFLRWRWRG